MRVTKESLAIEYIKLSAEIYKNEILKDVNPHVLNHIKVTYSLNDLKHLVETLRKQKEALREKL